jgi:apolipoprotein N-acyltransferase
MRRVLKSVFNPAFAFFALWFFASQFWLLEPLNLTTAGGYAARYAFAAYICVLVGLYAGAAECVARLAPKNKHWLAFPAAFAIMEWVRGSVYIGYPLGLVSFVWGDCLVVLQSLSLVGAYGLTFLTLLFASSLLSRHFKTATAVSAFVLAFGAVRLSLPEHAANYKVRMVDAPESTSSNAAVKDEEDLAAFLELSSADGAGDVDLFVWPEMALRGDLRFAWSANRAIAAFSESHAPVALGFLRTKLSRFEKTAIYNSMAVFDGSGIVHIYDKMTLTPIGEYAPLWMPIRLAGFEHRNLKRGESRSPIDLGGMKAMPYICFEAAYPGARVPGEANFILNLSSDARTPKGKEHYFNAARMRAIEEGVPVIRVASGGISAVISPFGRVKGRLEERGAKDAYVYQRIPRTLFSYTGNWLLIPLLAAWLAAMIWRKGVRRPRV